MMNAGVDQVAKKSISLQRNLQMLNTTNPILQQIAFYSSPASIQTNERSRPRGHTHRSDIMNAAAVTTKMCRGCNTIFRNIFQLCTECGGMLRTIYPPSSDSCGNGKQRDTANFRAPPPFGCVVQVRWTRRPFSGLGRRVCGVSRGRWDPVHCAGGGGRGGYGLGGSRSVLDSCVANVTGWNA